MGGAAAGNGGHGGAGGSGSNVCAASSTLDCSSGGALTLMPDGLVTDFSPAQWSSTTMLWCDADGLSGQTYSFAGTGATSVVTVDTTANNLKMAITVPANGYAGGGILFYSCVNASSFNALSFSAIVPTGNLTGCNWEVQLQTQDERPTTATMPGGGTCTASTCYQAPAVTGLQGPTSAGHPFTEPFTSFTGGGTLTAPLATQIVGVQWQVNGSASSGCTVELHTDDIKFVTQ